LFPLPFLDRFIGFNFPEDLTFVRYFDVGVLNSYKWRTVRLCFNNSSIWSGLGISWALKSVAGI
jgi:hypothetical protein